MLYESDRDNRYLMHYGVPGQKWGVITKEYQKVGYDHRYDHTQFKNRRSEQIAQQMRRQNAKLRRTTETNFYRNRARELGRSVGDNFFYESRKWDEDRKAKARKEAEKARRGDIVDRTVRKVARKLGVEQYSKMASETIKNFAKEQAFGALEKKAGQTLNLGGKWLGKALDKPAKSIATVAYKAADQMKVSSIIKNGARFTVRLGKEVAKAPKAIYHGAQWLRKGGYAKLKNAATHVAKGARFIRKNAHSIAEMLRKLNRHSHDSANGLVKKTRSFVQAGSKFIIRGAETLSEMLRRRSSK